MRINTVISEFLDVITTMNVPGLIMSTPGMGKTSSMKIFCKTHGYELVSLIASQYAADDILGIQSVVDGKLKRLAPSWFDELESISIHEHKRVILFIDEITTCDEFIQAPLLNLIFSRTLGGHRLRDNVRIVAAGNYEDNLNNAFKLTTPLVNRFLILNLTPDMIDLDEVGKFHIDNIFDSQHDKMLLEWAAIGTQNQWDSKSLTAAEMVVTKMSDCTRVGIENSTETGLVGFASIRSVHYSLGYLRTAFACGHFNEQCIKVVGDTLGKSTSGVSMTVVLLDTIQRTNHKTSIKVKSKVIESWTDDEFVEKVSQLVSGNEFTPTESVYQAIMNRKHILPEEVLEKVINMTLITVR